MPFQISYGIILLFISELKSAIQVVSNLTISYSNYDHYIDSSQSLIVITIKLLLVWAGMPLFNDFIDAFL